jgi:hypothetical protein
VRVRRVTDDVDTHRERIEALRGAWASVPGLGTDDLLALRREERKLEEHKARSLLGDRS